MMIMTEKKLATRKLLAPTTICVGRGSSAPICENMSVNTGTTFHSRTPVRTQGDDQDGDGISQGRLHLAHQLVHVFDVLGQAQQDGVQVARGLAGLDHAGVQFVEDLGVLLHGVGEVGAGLDVLAHLE